ncbi:MAG: ATPase [Caulobacterales bacterium]|nr:ATPase [Caulobacterales bacterium]
MTGSVADRPRRFYKIVAVEPRPGGAAVTLDGRTLKTPGKADLIAPTRALAEAVAAEWDAQTGQLAIDRMHLTRLANVAVDRVAETRADLARHVAAYAETDLVCHLAEEEPALKARQEAVFAPLRAWAGEALGLALVPAAGVLAAPQPADSLAAARAAAEALDDFRLAGLAHAAGLFGSAVLAFAVERGRITAEEAFAAFRIDEAWQEERWGRDEEAARRTAGLAAEAEALGRWFGALS